MMCDVKPGTAIKRTGWLWQWAVSQWATESDWLDFEGLWVGNGPYRWQKYRNFEMTIWYAISIQWLPKPEAWSAITSWFVHFKKTSQEQPSTQVVKSSLSVGLFGRWSQLLPWAHKTKRVEQPIIDFFNATNFCSFSIFVGSALVLASERLHNSLYSHPLVFDNAQSLVS